MSNMYYKIWADAIIKFRKHNPENRNWKLKILFFISFMNALSIWIILVWLDFFDILKVPLITIDIFPGDNLDKSGAFILEFALLELQQISGQIL